MEYPEDIFTEPESSDDTLANLGPLRALAGIWTSADGLDVNPKAAGPELQPYVERVAAGAIFESQMPDALPGPSDQCAASRSTT